MLNTELDTKLNTTFKTVLTVTIDHINYSNHLSHDRLITMMQEARIRFFESLGQSELEFYGTNLIMKSLTINYQQEVFRGEVLNFIITVNEIRGSGFSLNCDIINEQNKSVGNSKVVLIGLDHQTRKPTPFSDECCQNLSRYLITNPIT